ncbi:MAG: hypothetical protein Q8N88_01840 [Nanoarchaeota archaeon]|nr:hypothetical protein [Nanoarchaeota archaeon]
MDKQLLQLNESEIMTTNAGGLIGAFVGGVFGGGAGVVVGAVAAAVANNPKESAHIIIGCAKKGATGFATAGFFSPL